MRSFPILWQDALRKQRRHCTVASGEVESVSHAEERE
jgi:hypothetical protein